MKRKLFSIVALFVILCSFVLPLIDYQPVYAITDNHWINADGGNWSDGANWSLGHSTNATENAIFDTAFNVGKTVTVDATAYCYDMDWTGATNTPTLTLAASLNYYGDVTLINAMVIPAAAFSIAHASATDNTFTSNLVSIGARFSNTGTGKITLQDTLIAANTGALSIVMVAGTIDTNNQIVTCSGTIAFTDVSNKTLTMGSSAITCTAWNYSGSNLTVTANTATINISGTGACSLGSANYNGASFNLTGTAHTASGSPTGINVFTRNGTATKTDSLTLTSGTTLGCTTFAMIGNSATNRLLVQSSTLGTAATVNATNWTGTVNVDIMDISATNTVDLSGITGNSGDCGGNTNITFTTAATQTWDGTTGSWSSSAKWTSRVPLPQDDVSAGGAGNTITVDMPRIGKSITFTGTPTISLSNDIANYGSWTMVSGMTYTHNNKSNYYRGRSNYTLTSALKNFYYIYIYAPSGTYTLGDELSITQNIAVTYGSFATGNFNLTCRRLTIEATGTSMDLGSSTVTLNKDSTTPFGVYGGSLTAGTSTIKFEPTVASVTMTGGSKTYNNVTMQGAVNFALTITGNNIFNTFTVDRSAASKTLTLTASSNQTVSNFVCATSGLNTLTIGSTGAAATLTKTGGSYINIDYLNLSNNTGSPSYTWFYESHSVIGAGVTYWYASAAPAAPLNVAATDGTHTDKVVVTWDKSTGGAGYRVYEDSNLLATLGDVATYDDNAAPAPTITTGTITATDGTYTNKVTLTLTGASSNNGTARTYHVVAFNAAGDSPDSATDTGYIGVGALTYQWQVSAADSDAGYGDIAGATTVTYDYSAAPVPTLTAGTASASDGSSSTYVTLSVSGDFTTTYGRYYRCNLTATGATNTTTGVNRGYIGAGPMTYQWYRSAGDSAASYSILTGATTDPYNDTEYIAPPNGRYYLATITATGTITANTTADRGYMTSSISAIIYEYNTSTSQNCTSIYSTNMSAQTFTAVSSHTITFIDLMLYKTGTPGDVTVGIYRASSANVTTGTALITGTIDDATIGTANNTWVRCTFSTALNVDSGLLYAIVVSAPSGSVGNSVCWERTNADSYADGNACTTADSITWTAQAYDFLFRIWGTSLMEIQDVKVFEGFKSTGDWLIVVRYLNIYPPYYDTYDVKQYFDIQLLDTGGTLRAGTACPDWGNKVGCIYMSASTASSLSWGSAYTIQLYGKSTGHPTVSYILQSTDWIGVDLNLLDAWAITSAGVIGDYYGEELTTTISTRGEVLNPDGAGVLNVGIPGLMIVRPNIFQVSKTTPSSSTPTFTQTNRKSNWQTIVGPDTANMLTDIGSIISVDGRTIGVFICIILMIVLAAFGLGPAHSMASNVITIPILFMAAGLLFLDQALIAIIFLVLSVLALWQFVLNKGG